MGNQVPSWALWVPFLSSVFGAAVTGAATYFINKTNKDSETNIKRRELFVKVALEDYRQSFEIAKTYIGSDKEISLAPIETYIIHANILADLILNNSKEITEEQYIEALKKSEKLIAAHKNYKRENH